MIFEHGGEAIPESMALIKEKEKKNVLSTNTQATATFTKSGKGEAQVESLAGVQYLL